MGIITKLPACAYMLWYEINQGLCKYLANDGFNLFRYRLECWNAGIFALLWITL